MRWILRFGLWLVLVTLATAAPAAAPSIPDALQPWVPWVLPPAEDHRACPLGSGDAGTRLCAWPQALTLELEARGGRFSQTWRLYAESWMVLPGERTAWPQAVTVNGAPAMVLERDGRPALYLPAGRHHITGTLIWARRPDGLALPPEVGLVQLRLDGEPVVAPRIDAQQRLWLGADPSMSEPTAEPDRLALVVTRLIRDGVPLRVTTRLELEVSGEPRELTLHPLLAGSTPLRASSPLPLQLDAAGQLTLQIRPGQWVVELESWYADPLPSLQFAARPAPWPTQEVWAFRAAPEVRQVELGGAPTIDPRQTRLPSAWQGLPTYLLEPDASLIIEQQQRGQSERNRLHLRREVRLDFAGQGLSVRDQIRSEGVLVHDQRLEARPPLRLGQVQVNGEPRFITQREDALEGIELRAGSLNLIADGRLEQLITPWQPISRWPISSWNQTFESIETQLHLPPGWQLIHLNGVDHPPPTWVDRWSLLDLFLVLIASLAMARLWGWRWGLITLVTLTLTWTAPQAPQLVWLHAIAAAALLQLVPEREDSALRWLRLMVLWYGRVVLVVLAATALIFLTQELRGALFPQLAPLVTAAPSQADQRQPSLLTPQIRAESARENLSIAMQVGRDALDRTESSRQRTAPPPPPPQPLTTMTADTKVQTGLGVPDWTWRSLSLRWSGAVTADQTMQLWLLSPGGGLLLALVQLLLVPLLALKLTDRLQLPPLALKPAARIASALLAIGTLTLLWSAPPAQADTTLSTGSFPPPALLDALRERLLTPPECAPQCASIPQLNLTIEGETLRLMVLIDASHATAVALPLSLSSWTPHQVQHAKTATAVALRRGQQDQLLALVPAGRHWLRLQGPLPDSDSISLPLPLRPHLVTADLDRDWRLEGVNADGVPSNQLRLVRQQPAPATPTARRESPTLPPLLEIERQLNLGLNWTVETRVRRLSPEHSAVDLWVPLLPGESVISDEMQVENGQIFISLSPGEREQRWSSRLDDDPELLLQATDHVHLLERWCLLASPLWHVTSTGIPPSASGCTTKRGQAQRPQTWQPWPGEKLTLSIRRPSTVPGPTLTLDASAYHLKPGRRATTAKLQLTLRSSQGGRYRLPLPEQAQSLKLTINGQSRAVVVHEGALELPLVPGSQTVVLEWQQPTGLALWYQPPAVTLDLPAVNARTRIELGSQRWVLWGWGDGWGPAVLFWPLLIVLAVLAWGLSRLPFTPLTFIDWLLLAIGLSQAELWIGALVAGWLLALGWRRGHPNIDAPAWQFNLRQIGLVLLTVVALLGLFTAVQQGLLGTPAMHIAGNGSSQGDLRWYLDRVSGVLGEVGVISVPLLVYRGLMLAWALWLALRLLDWLRWGWRGLSEPTLWRSKPPPPQPPPLRPNHDQPSVNM